MSESVHPDEVNMPAIDVKKPASKSVPPIASVNDFVVKFANVNGSGSASANALFAKSVFRMGIPVTPRNIFPSNIQGLPTWYEVRISERGYTARRAGGVDFMVSVNPQSMADDVREVRAGGYFFYDSCLLYTSPSPRDRTRSRMPSSA